MPEARLAVRLLLLPPQLRTPAPRISGRRVQLSWVRGSGRRVLPQTPSTHAHSQREAADEHAQPLEQALLGGRSAGRSSSRLSLSVCWRAGQVPRDHRSGAAADAPAGPASLAAKAGGSAPPPARSPAAARPAARRSRRRRRAFSSVTAKSGLHRLSPAPTNSAPRPRTARASPTPARPPWAGSAAGPSHLVLPAQPDRRAARQYQHRQPGAGSAAARRPSSAAGQHLLEVVEHQQLGSRPRTASDQHVQQRPPARSLHADRPRRPPSPPVPRIGDRRASSTKHAPCWRCARPTAPGGALSATTGLADAAGARPGYQAAPCIVAQQQLPAPFAARCSSPDERRRLERQDVRLRLRAWPAGGPPAGRRRSRERQRADWSRPGLGGGWRPTTARVPRPSRGHAPPPGPLAGADGRGRGCALGRALARASTARQKAPAPRPTDRPPCRGCGQALPASKLLGRARRPRPAARSASASLRQARPPVGARGAMRPNVAGSCGSDISLLLVAARRLADDGRCTMRAPPGDGASGR